MATAQIPPPPSHPSLPRVDAAEVPVLVLELQDDLTRSHVREAFWVSVVVHLLVVIVLATSPRWYPAGNVYVANTSDLLRNKELTYLEAPPDNQQVPKPDTNIISDKNRIATTHKAPTIDRETLQRLRDMRRPGAPGNPGVPSPPPVIAQGPAQPQPQQQQPAGKPGQPTGTPPDQGQMAKLETPTAPRPVPGAFGGSLSPGSAIAQAARATAMSRGAGGVSGEFGLGPNASQGKVRSDIDIVSDTMGVDFGPYLSRVLQSVRMNWYALIPEVARSPLMKRGKVSIQFAILKDGRVAGLQLLAPSGDVSLDRAAWGGITASDPFPPLPREFGGPYLALRFHFYYNPDKKDLE